MASTEALEERISVVEREVAELKQALSGREPADVAWWEKMFGSFSESEGFEEAVRLGREYRESLRPKSDEKAI